MPTVLVIDDEPNVLYSLESSLGACDFEVLTAGTGRHGIDLARRQSPDAVLLDVRLGDMNGLDVFGELRRANPHLPVILMTAFTTTQTAIEATRRGAFDYLLKPVDLHQLRQVLARAVDTGRLARAPAVLNGTPHRSSGRLGLHVLEVMHSILEGAATGQPRAITTTLERPAVLEDADAALLWKGLPQTASAA